jgi:formate C-acetyltransferase
VEYTNELFSAYKTPDGGPVYTAMAANTSNIWAGAMTAATPDGRRHGMPVSDAASPSYGKDVNGPTAVVLSLAKPDYTLVGTGSVVNQKYTADIFKDAETRKKLLSLLKVYFARGGQEMQINAVSRETLKNAMDDPGKYAGLVVRVSGFSAYFVHLERCVQEDILNRTDYGSNL